MLGELWRWIKEEFEVEIGPNLSEDDEGNAYVTHVYECEDEKLDYEARMSLTGYFNKGARKLVFRGEPVLEQDGDGTRRVRMIFTAYDAWSKLVSAPEGVRELTPEERETITQQVNNLPVEGYEVLRPTEEAILMCAVLIHRVTKAMNDAHNEYTVPWEQSKGSVISGIKALLKDPSLSPEQMHEKWAEYKRAEGWVYGVSKDPVAKTHPCLVPHSQLGPFAKSKDGVFGAIVRTFFGLEGRT